MKSTVSDKKILEPEMKVINLSLFLFLFLIANIIRSEEVIVTDWEIVDGVPKAWEFLTEGIQCEVANVGMHRILSK